MQNPTCTGIRVRTTADAHLIFQAVQMNVFPIIFRRLDREERLRIAPGNVYVWEEWSPSNTMDLGTGERGIERWTDSIRWGTTSVRDDFLFCTEKRTDQNPNGASQSMIRSKQSRPSPKLVKQTYSAFVETSRGRKKWHLVAYYNNETVNQLRTVDDIPQLKNVMVSPGMYQNARMPRTPASASGVSQLIHRRSPQPRPLPPIFHPTNQPPPVSTGSHGNALVPLSYLKMLPPPRRHSVDEKALMSFKFNS
ncbi:hypothetical protein FISHEDRAFT_39785 [Fistulina hepatica ATCC 64428]|uniref:cAMP-independent regulatory protein pac2 n=1 Tax=Fistulina hepatica ATCC 64428 TaxID=1128425 RepID=A0A0D7AFS1_9AGAR|nr:hypothetical protein FISHEDRAFT_39785 [Fistulina hepatica ATCC 64428]